jgi:uncharacterized membrane protein (DUF2068 family)
MKRSTGVTVSAILVFLGSGLTLVFGALMAFAIVFMPRTPAQPPFVRYALAFMIVLYMAFAIWGIASGVGLLLLKRWARISMIVFSCILLFFTVPALVIVPFLPMPRPPDSAGDIVLAMKIGMSVFYGIFAAIGGGWLYFFNRKSVKEQFSRPAEVVDSTAPAFPRVKRPLSISIIGWLLAATSVLALPTPLLGFPMLFMGFLVTGWKVTLFMLTWCIVQGIAGVGLLRLRSWGRTLSICLFSFGLLNVAAMAVRPGAITRLEQMNADMQARMQAKMGLPPTGLPTAFPPQFTHVFMWFGVVFGIGFTALQLWFVITRKDAFTAANDVAALSP